MIAPGEAKRILRVSQIRPADAGAGSTTSHEASWTVNKGMKATGAVLILAGLLYGCMQPEPPAFDGAAALRLVEKQVSFGPRVPGTEAHRLCARWIESELASLTDRVSRQKFRYVRPVPLDTPANWQPDTTTMWNIIASFNLESQDRIAICAHWDTRPWADEEEDSTLHDTPIAGANDGGSGVAVLLELGRLMSIEPPPIGVDLIFFDGEDFGPVHDLGQYLLGSKQFVANAPGYRPMAMILLDMVGDADLSLPRERFSDSLAFALTDLVWSKAAALKLSAFVDTVGLPVVDDHLPWLINGIPAVDIIDFDYPYWHTLEDTPDKVSSESLATVGTLVRELIYFTSAEEYRAAGSMVRPRIVR